MPATSTPYTSRPRRWLGLPIAVGGIIWMTAGAVLSTRPAGAPPYSFRATADMVPWLGLGLLLIGCSTAGWLTQHRFHFGRAESDPKLEAFEAALATRPAIQVPSITLDGTEDPLKPGGTAHHASMFTARHEHRVLKAVHNIPSEDPSAFADAILTVRKWLSETSSSSAR